MKSDQRRASGDRDAETRRRLVTATHRLLSQSGGAPITSRAIAEAADANLGAITYYFGSKQNLVAEAMMTLAGSLLEPVIEVLSSGREPVSKLMETVRVLNETLSEYHREAATYVQVLAAASAGATIARELRTLLRMVESLLAEQIELQQRDGLLPSWIEPAAMSRLIVAVVHGTLVAAALDGDSVDQTAVGSQFVQLLLAARMKPSS